jgi:Ca-activated chloride channel family protein
MFRRFVALAAAALAVLALVTEVNATSATLDAPAEAPGGSVVEIKFTGPANPGDIITIVRPSDPDSKYGWYKNADDGSPATLSLRLEPGEYEIRYMNAQTGTVLARRKILATPIAAVTLDGPFSVPLATDIAIIWTGPNNEADYITIARADGPDDEYRDYKYTREGSPLVLRAPPWPGAYEIRYINDRESKVLARRPLTVLDAVATLEAPASAKAGSEIEIKWVGPGGPSDYVSVAEEGADEKAYVSYFYIRDGGPWRLKMPDRPGRYEVRYVVEDAARIIGRRPIRVE